MDEALHKTEKPHSIAIKRNAKGEYGWDIKAYLSDKDLDNPTGIETKVQKIDSDLRAQYLQ